MTTILIIDDDLTLNSTLTDKFHLLGWEVESWSELRPLTTLTCNTITHCLLDLNLGNSSALEFIPTILDRYPSCKIVVFSGFATLSTGIHATKLGATYVLQKPSSFTQIMEAFNHSVDQNTSTIDSEPPTGLWDLEQDLISKTLADNQFNISKTAAILGMHRRTLQRRLKKR